MTNTLRIRLLTAFLITISSIASFTANYAMIYHQTAALVSIVALLISLYGLIKLYFYSKESPTNGFLLALTGTFLYSLNKALILIILAGLLFKNSGFLKKRIGHLPAPVSRMEKAGSVLLVATLFLINDLSREFSVWHKIQWNYLPLIGFGLSLLWLFFEWKRLRD
jgi:hypothetical protein